MYNIALVDKHTKEKTYLQTFHGVKATWITEQDAKDEIDRMKITSSYFGCLKSEPKNFDYVIEPTPDTITIKE